MLRWERADLTAELAEETPTGLESRYIEPLLGEVRSVARRFDLLAEASRESENPEVQRMAQSLELAARMLDDLLEEALEISLRRAVEDNVWSDARPLDDEEPSGDEDE